MMAGTSAWTKRSLDDAVPEQEEEEEDEEREGVGAGEYAQEQPTDAVAAGPEHATNEEQLPSPGDRRDSGGSLSDRNTAGLRRAHLQQRPSSPNTGNGGLPSASGSPRIPAAGFGTRVGPRPIPKSSSSLRHISSKGRTVSFGAPVPENRDPNELDASVRENRSLVERNLEAAQRRTQERLQRESVMESETDDDEFAFGTPGTPDHRPYPRKGKAKNLDQALDQYESVKASGDGLSSSDDDDWGVKMPDVRVTEHMHDKGQEQDEAGRLDGQQSQERARSKRSNRKIEASLLLDDDSSPILGSSSGLRTPGPRFPQDLHTPVSTPPELNLDNTVTAQERLEWHAMLQSVLRSEVLKSETKRITSADAPSLTRQQLMYKRWLDIRASLRGRGFQRGAAEAEEKRLNNGWPILIKRVIESIQTCRRDAVDGHEDLASEEAKDAVVKEVGDLLAQVDSAEEQFPSFRKISEVMPEWRDEKLQHKLDGLYSWYNVTDSLRLQIKILQEWTGSKSLDVLGTQRFQDGAGNEDEYRDHRAELEEGTFLERILKENSLQSTFEKRTLRTLSQLILKAKDAIIKHHSEFSDMALPSFESELVQLINFPTRLMEGALRVRLDYVGKLTDPSVLIVDSLIDDLRAAIALACRIKIQYTSMMLPQPELGWDLPPCIGSTYDAVLREALQYFFKLLNYKLKGSLFFKETEILEPEWRFLSTAVEVIEGADVLVARSITKIVNKLFIRIVRYFERELSAPSTRRVALNEDDGGSRLLPAMVPPSSATRAPPIAGGLTKGQVKMTLEEKSRWIHQVFDSVRIRSRKLLGFARDIRNRLENAAEYDLNTLRSPQENSSSGRSTEPSSSAEGTPAETNATALSGQSSPHAPNLAKQSGTMDLTEFLQTLINAGYFLVLTSSFEAEGVYLIAEPSLHNKPEIVQELFTKCLRRVGPQDEESAIAAAEVRVSTQNTTHTVPDESGKDDDSDTGGDRRPPGAQPQQEEQEQPKYLLVLTPRDAFMWTGKVMVLKMDRVDVDLKDRRLRLIADGPQRRLELCKRHLYGVFGADYAATSIQQVNEDNAEDSQTQRSRRQASAVKNGQVFPLEIVDESLAHMSAVQSELRRINKGVYMLSDTVNRAVPKVRRRMRGKRGERSARLDAASEYRTPGKGGDCDELIQNCFSMASEQGFRAMPFIESARLRGQMTLALARLAIDWVAFICDDCEPTDRKTFKWAVAALENAMHVTRSDGILHISEDDFMLMRSKVASCVGLLISHFDILGARSSVAKAKEEEERLERERAERNRALEAAAGLSEVDVRQQAAKLVEGSGGAGAPPMLGRADSGMQATEERWVQKVMEWDAARQTIEAEQRLIGRVLDDTRLEDRGLQFLASSSSRIQIRWQQGRFIGGGTFGTVYLAVNLDSGGLMAVKEIRFQDISSTPGMYKQIKDEMSVMEMLSHPNIVEYYGIEVHRDKVYIFEEYCQGGSLAQLLEHGRIEDEMVMQVYTLQMLDGLVYLHSKGVVHRDIKPDNILLDHMGVIKFVDFGAAKVLAKNSRTIQRSRRPGIVGPKAMAGMLGPDGKPGAAASLQGTPMYMSPEVIKGESRGRRGAMDVWSLGCVVLEFATGRRPWSQLDNEWAIMFHIGMAQQHPPLPEPGQLSELGIDFIRRCLIIDPYERPSAAEMREHAWIKNLVEALNEANEEEDAVTATGASSSTSSIVPRSAGFSGESESTSRSSSFIHADDSAAGVAAMVATPGVRSINGFNFKRPPAPSFNSSSSSFSRLSAESPTVAQGYSNPAHGTPPLPSTAATTAMSNEPGPSGTEASKAPFNEEEDEEAAVDRPVHDPGHPNHNHPGYEALIADLAYRREEKQTRAMVAPSTDDLAADMEEAE